MTTTEVLKAESKKHRAIADKIDALIAELQGDSESNSSIPPPRPSSMIPPGAGEYSNLKQADAIRLVLKKYGPQTTTEIFHRLSAGGMPFKKVPYVTAILARFRDEWERTVDGKISLKTEF